MRLIACFGGLLVVVLTTLASAEELRRVAPEREGFSSVRLDRTMTTLTDYADTGRIPGAVVLVQRNGRVVLHDAVGYQDLEASVPMAADTIFRIASQTKAIVSVGVMMLQEEGKLLIGDALGQYLPEFQQTTVALNGEHGGFDVVAADRPITIRDLLTHTAGVGYGYGPAAERWAAAGIQGWYFAHREEPVRETVRRMAGLPMDAQPGSKYVYGYSTDILGALIEVVSGQSLADFLRVRLFEPLDMRDSHFYLPEEKQARLATVYSVDEAGKLSRAPDVSAMVGQGAYAEGPKKSYSGGAGLLSTARDYGRFLQMLASGGILENQRILSRHSVQLMVSDHLNGIDYPPGQGFGLGFAVTLDVGARGVPGSLGEYGWGGAYHTVYFVDPIENLVVVYLTQILPATGLDDARKVRSLIYSALEN